MLAVMALAWPLCAVSGGTIFVPFVPRGVIQNISDAITGEQGNGCVTESQKVGDVITFAPGNTATITAISGKSSYCKLPQTPVRATLEYKLTLHSDAGILLPDGFKVLEPQQWQRLVGIVVHAEDSNRGIELFVSAKPLTDKFLGQASAERTSIAMASNMEGAERSEVTVLEINGTQAYRFTVSGKLKTTFASHKTSLVTIVQSGQEIVTVNAISKTSDFKDNQEIMIGLAQNVKSGATVPENPQ